MKKSKVLFSVILSFVLLIVNIFNFCAFAENEETAAKIMRDGAEIASFATIQEAIDAARENDTVIILEGVHHESFRVNKNIVLKGEEGKKVVLDGAYEQLQKPNNMWKETEGGIYEASLPYKGDNPQVSWISYYATDDMIYPYLNEERFTAFENGEGSLRNSNTVRLILDGGKNPNETPLNVPKYSYIIKVLSACTIQDVIIKNAIDSGISFDYDISDVSIDNVEIINCHRGINAPEVNNVSITNCNIHNGWSDKWAWERAYESGVKDAGAPARGHGIYITAANNSNISDNVIYRMWDSMHIGGENVCVSNNTIYNIYDDAVELESDFVRNFHFYNNTMYDTFSGISIVPDHPGPLYIYRNTVICNKVVRWKATGNSKNNGQCLKMGVGSPFMNCYIYNNSFYGLGTVIFDKNQAQWDNIHLYNNIFYSTLEFTSDDMMRSTSAGNIGRPNTATFKNNLWRKTAVRKDSIADYNDAGGVVGDPMYTNPLSSPPDISLKPESIAIDAGADIGDLPDSVTVTDGKYDIGTFELGGGIQKPDMTPPIQVILDEKDIIFDQNPIIKNGRTLVPLRKIFESFGLEVLWDSSAQSVTASNADFTIKLTVNNSLAYINEKQTTLDQPPEIINGRTLVPIRFIAESLKATVDWDEALRKITITTPNAPAKIPVEIPEGKPLFTTDNGVVDSSLVFLLPKLNMNITEVHAVRKTRPMPYTYAISFDVADNSYEYAINEPLGYVKFNASETFALEKNGWVYVSFYIRLTKPDKTYADTVTVFPCIGKSGAPNAKHSLYAKGEVLSEEDGWVKKSYAVKLEREFGKSDSTGGKLDIFLDSSKKQYIEISALEAVYFGKIDGDKKEIEEKILQKMNENV